MQCNALNFILFQQLKRPEAPPFLGLLTLSADRRAQALEQIRSFIGGNPDRLRPFFKSYGYLAGWAVTHVLNDVYSSDERRIYAPIGEVLGLALTGQSVRRDLHEGFLGVCDKLGLPSRGLERSVDLYLLHAGVAKSQLPHLVAAFQRHKDLYGAPPVESSMQLNRWEDDALDHLSEMLVRPRRPILWDETAWHARLFARISANPEGFKPASAFELAFQQAYVAHQAERGKGGASGVAAPARPKLVWTDDGLSLRLPRSKGRISLRLDGNGQSLRLKGGEDWPLEQPWPRRMSGTIEGTSFALEFLAEPGRFAVFDMALGQFLAETRVDGRRDLMLDTSDVLIAARQAFSLEGRGSIALGDGCHVQRASLGTTPVRLVIGQQVMTLATQPRRRLTLSGGDIAEGGQGKLRAPSAVLTVETGLGLSEVRTLRITADGRETLAEMVITDGRGTKPIAELLPSGLGASPGRIRFELMAPDSQEHSSGISLESWVWPGYLATEGLAYRCDPVPGNFLPDQSSRIARYEDGLHLDPKGGYAAASAAFACGGEVAIFRFPWPDVTLLRHRSDGSVTPVAIGSRLQLGADDRFGHVSVRCPDPGASLRVGDRIEGHPFALGMTRNLSLAELTQQGKAQTVVLRRSNGAEVVLFEIVDALHPTRFELRPTRTGLRISLALGTLIDGLAIEAEDELGQVHVHEIALGRRPTCGPAPSWARLALSAGDPHEVVLTIDQAKADQGLVLGRLFVRPDGAEETWRPLRNPRGDIYALPLTSTQGLEAAPFDQAQARFQTLCRWLSECFARDCWLDHGLERSLPLRWSALGRMVAGYQLGASFLMRATFLPPPEGTSASWVPIIHPIEIDPGLYSATPLAFAALGDLESEALTAGALMSRLEGGKTGFGLLDTQAILAFENAASAARTGEALTGFRAAKFFGLFPHLDHDPSAGWFWHGTPILGPAHLRAAHQAMIERFQAAKVFAGTETEGGGNSRRADALFDLARHVDRRTSPCRPTLPRRDEADANVHAMDQAAATTLSEFARASRAGTAATFVERLAVELGQRPSDILSSLGFLLRLAPEIFFYFLLVWQLAKVRP